LVHAGASATAREAGFSAALFPYWLLFSLFAAGAVQYAPDGTRRVQGDRWLTIGVVAVILLIGLRFEIGADWNAYGRMYEATAYLDLLDTIFTSDPGYMLLNWIAQRLGLGLWAVNTTCAILFTWGLVRFSRRQPNPWLAVLVAVPYLVIVVAMGYTRQAVAIGLILAGLVSLAERQSLLRFGFYLLIAAMFHKTAVIILPLVALAIARNRIVIVGSSVLLGAMLFYFFLNPRFDMLVENYVVTEYDSEGALVRIAMNLIPAALLLMFPSRFTFNDFERRLWRNLSFATIASFLLFFIMESSAVLDRLALYLIPLQLLVFSRAPYVLSTSRAGRTQILFLVIFYSALIQYVWLNYATHAANWLPYQVYTGQRMYFDDYY
jgi:hypothetical protein